MMGAVSSSSPLILRCILRRPPLSTTTATHIYTITPSFIKLFKPTPSTISLPIPPLRTPRSLSIAISDEEHTPTDVVSEVVTDDDHPIPVVPVPVDAKISSAHKEMLAKLKGMSVKEKKELGSYANSLGKKLKSQQVGKSGVTDSVATALVETLEANELLKLKIHNNCPGELDDVVNQLEEATGSVVVGRIGRTVIIYRPSLTKLIAEEKKKQAQKVFLKRRMSFKSSFQGKSQSRRPSSTPSSRSRDFRKS